jgi:hypothetical protein
MVSVSVSQQAFCLVTTPSFSAGIAYTNAIVLLHVLGILLRTARNVFVKVCVQ